MEKGGRGTEREVQSKLKFCGRLEHGLVCRNESDVGARRTESNDHHRLREEHYFYRTVSPDCRHF
jgi:hypothetical protein